MLVIGLLACFCLLAAAPVVLGLWLMMTTKAKQSNTTQTGQFYYVELLPCDSNHTPCYPIEDAIVEEETDAERIERIRRKVNTPTPSLLPKRKTETETDHNLTIIK